MEQDNKLFPTEDIPEEEALTQVSEEATEEKKPVRKPRRKKTEITEEVENTKEEPITLFDEPAAEAEPEKAPSAESAESKSMPQEAELAAVQEPIPEEALISGNRSEEPISPANDAPRAVFEDNGVLESCSSETEAPISEISEESSSDAEISENKKEEASEPQYEGDDMYSLRFFPDELPDEEIPEEKLPEDEPEKEEQKPYNPEKPRRVDGRFDLVELFVFTLVIVMFITSFIFRHSIVEGPSMEGTLYEGEHLIISDLFYEPDYGDIIVCEDYSTKIYTPIVKRVIALGGDKVEITKNGEVFVNEQLLDESDYVFINEGVPSPYKDMVLTVPEGEIFVMGDHRNESTDSRNFGTISEDSVLGKVVLRFFPLDRFGAVK